MKELFITCALLFAVQSYAAVVTNVAEKCESKVQKAAEKAITEEDASGIVDITPSEYEQNVFIAGYAFPECYGSVSVKIQPTVTKVVEGKTVAIDCKILTAKDDQDPNCD
jgi:hypothetical protein